MRPWTSRADRTLDRFLDRRVAERRGQDPAVRDPLARDPGAGRGEGELDVEIVDLVGRLEALRPVDWGVDGDDVERYRRRTVRRRRFATGISVVVAVALVAAALATGGGPRPRPPAAATPWRVAGYVRTVTWGPAQAVSTSGITVSCPSARACLALDASGAGRQVVEVSATSGASWASVGLPPGAQATSGISCPSVELCAFGGTSGRVGGVWTTRDGGRSWSFASLPAAGTVSNLDCPSAAACYATVVTVSAADEVTAAALVASSDGARRWTARRLPRGFVPGGPQALHCLGREICLLGGSSGSTGAAAVLRSTDAGSTWRPTSVPAPAGIVTQVACTEGSCLALAAGPTPQSPRRLIASHDGGLRWRFARAPAAVGLPLVVSCAVGTCLVGGSRGPGAPAAAIAATTDAGGSFTAQAVPVAVADGQGGNVRLLLVTGVACSPGGSCIALAGGPSSTHGDVWAALGNGGPG